MALNRNFDIEELIEHATQANTDKKDTIDDLIYCLSEHKQILNKNNLPPLSDIIESDINLVDVNNKKSIKNAINSNHKKYYLDKIFYIFTFLAGAIGYFMDFTSFIDYLIQKFS